MKAGPQLVEKKGLTRTTQIAVQPDWLVRRNWLELRRASAGALLFHLPSKLYERTSVIITTNLSFNEWATVFGGAKMNVCQAIAAPNVGIAVDVYHVWWDTGLAKACAEAGDRIIGENGSAKLCPGSGGIVLLQAK